MTPIPKKNLYSIAEQLYVKRMIPVPNFLECFWIHKYQSYIYVVPFLLVPNDGVPNGWVPKGWVPNGRVPNGRVPKGWLPIGRVPKYRGVYFWPILGTLSRAKNTMPMMIPGKFVTIPCIKYYTFWYLLSPLALRAFLSGHTHLQVLHSLVTDSTHMVKQ